MAVIINDTFSEMPKDWMYYSQVLDEELGEALPSIESDFTITLGTEASAGDIKFPAVDRLINNKVLFSVMDANIPNLGFSFSNTPPGSGFIESSLEPGENVQISYWDTAQQSETRIIEKYYLSQFSEIGTFRMGYRSQWLHIRIGTMVITLSKGVVTRPIPLGISAASNQLLKYKFNFAYEDYKVEYIDAEPTKIPSIAFETLRV